MSIKNNTGRFFAHIIVFTKGCNYKFPGSTSTLMTPPVSIILRISLFCHREEPVHGRATWRSRWEGVESATPSARNDGRQLSAIGSFFLVAQGQVKHQKRATYSGTEKKYGV